MLTSQLPRAMLQPPEAAHKLSGQN